MPRSNTLLLIGLGLNVVGTATIFMFAYPPQDERRHRIGAPASLAYDSVAFDGAKEYLSVPRIFHVHSSAPAIGVGHLGANPESLAHSPIGCSRNNV